MSVVGFDLGAQNNYIAVARQGGIEVITNDYSLHATPSCVVFTDKNRVGGVAARQQMLGKLKNSITSVKHLLGRKYSDAVVTNEQKWMPCKLVKLPDDYLGIEVTYLNEKRVFTPEQVLAMNLLKLKQITDDSLKDVGIKVNDCVLSVPCYFTDAQRRAVLDAAKIADLNCLKILNETTAVALAYGIYKQDLPEDKEKPRKVLFLDVGASSAQACVAAFNKAKLTMLGSNFVTVGGRDFDSLIREYFRGEIKDKYKMDPFEQPRAWFRLLDESEKIKKQMSSCSNALPLNIECFMNDKDVHSSIQRSQFEELMVGSVNQLQTLLQDLLAHTKLSVNDIDTIELVGGSCRIPAIKQMVIDMFKQDPKTTMNMDEAVARGCAMQCAILSPTFRVREFNVTDCQPFSIKIDFPTGTGDSSRKLFYDDGEMIVFEEFHQFPFSKMLTFYRNDAFTIDASYTYPNKIPYPSRNIGRFQIDGITASATGESRKVKVKVRLNANGVFTVSSACLVEQKEVEPDADKIEPMDIGSQDGVDAPKSPESGDQQNGDDQANGNSKDEEMNDEDSKEGKEKKPAKKKLKTVNIDLPVTEQIVGAMTTQDLNKFKGMEKDMQKVDYTEKAKNDAKNTVEEYVYEMREKLATNLEQFVKPDDADKLNGLLSATEEWLYEDGEDCDIDVYTKKLAELTKYGDPIVERYREFEIRKPAFDQLGQSLMRTQKFIEQFMAGDPKYDHLEPKEVEKVRKVFDEKMHWYNETMQKQSNKPLTDAPIVFASQIHQEREALERVATPVMTKSKPKPKVEEPPPAPQQQQQPDKSGKQQPPADPPADYPQDNHPPQNKRNATNIEVNPDGDSRQTNGAGMDVDDAAVF